MRVFIHKSAPSGSVNAPPSKSITHRMILCAALSEGTSVIRNIDPSNDISATLDAISSFGASYGYDNGTLTVTGVDAVHLRIQNKINCRECGSTLRFVIPLCMISETGGTLTGSARLLERPLMVFERICTQQGICYDKKDEYVHVGGGMQNGVFTVPGDVSSQFITGLLFALPLLQGDSRIILTGKTESRPYIDLTLYVQRLFGIENTWINEHTLYVKGGRRYHSASVENEGDWSNAAFLLAFHHLGYHVDVMGVNDNSLQGDSVCKEMFFALKQGSGVFDLSDCPDLAPVLFAFAAANRGGVFTGTKRLRIKESDRASAMAQELLKFGCETVVTEDTVTVHPCALHAPQTPLCGHNDHRIVMSLAVLCVITGGVIEGAEAVNKSYPRFFEDLKRLKVDLKYEA